MVAAVDTALAACWSVQRTVPADPATSQTVRDVMDMNHAALERLMIEGVERGDPGMVTLTQTVGLALSALR